MAICLSNKTQQVLTLLQGTRAVMEAVFGRNPGPNRQIQSTTAYYIYLQPKG
jgi:hypothetical protein